MKNKINILVIDDDVSAEIKENIEDFKFKDFGLSIDTAISLDAAKNAIEKAKMNREFYDVLIVDMKMGGGEEIGLNILNLRGPSITIVLTGHASIENCLKCMNAGAYDYIDKNSHLYDPYERLKESISKALDERLINSEDLFKIWLNKNYMFLKKTYNENYIAVIDEFVVDSDENLITLEGRMKKQYPFLRSKVVNLQGYGVK